MTTDTDTARALEVLRKLCIPEDMDTGTMEALVALYAAAVELRAATEAHVAAATKNEQEWKHTEVHETRKRQHAAHLAFVEALAAVPKAVNRG